MKTILALWIALGGAAAVRAAEASPQPEPPYYQVRYETSAAEGGLKLGVTCTIWIPPGAKILRGVIVHQHGCGEPACQGGATAAYDLHWQALARKWECALLGPSYHQQEKDNCAWWSDPRNGSEQTFLRALTDLAGRSGHAELERVPWVLWGHSGGANWAGTMLLLHPDRTVCVWLRSGSPRLFSADAPGGTPSLLAAALGVPVMCNLGIKEKEGRFARVWETTLAFFNECRSKGGLVALAIDPRTSHECGDSRYLAMLWIDACLAARLPAQPGAPLQAMTTAGAWLAGVPGDTAQPGTAFAGNPTNAAWLPNAAVAKAWTEYVKTGATSDDTPPPAPTQVRVTADGRLTWEAEADFESGLAGFIIERDGVELVRLPEKPLGRFGRPLFQTMSYHDTPEKPLPEMRYHDTTAPALTRPGYNVRAVNSVGLKSAPARAIYIIKPRS